MFYDNVNYLFTCETMKCLKTSVAYMNVFIAFYKQNKMFFFRLGLGVFNQDLIFCLPLTWQMRNDHNFRRNLIVFVNVWTKLFNFIVYMTWLPNIDKHRRKTLVLFSIAWQYSRSIFRWYESELIHACWRLDFTNVL